MAKLCDPWSDKPDIAGDSLVALTTHYKRKAAYDDGAAHVGVRSKGQIIWHRAVRNGWVVTGSTLTSQGALRVRVRETREAPAA